MKPLSRPWTPGEIERLKKLAADGASAARVAAALNRKIVSVKLQARKSVFASLHCMSSGRRPDHEPQRRQLPVRERISALDTQLAILAIIFLVVIDIVVVRLNLI